jgi:hypothetical protein
MKKKFMLVVLIQTTLVLGTFISCVSTSFNGPTPRQVPEDFFGVSPDRINLAEAIPILDELGAVWRRTTIHWDGVERQPGVWNFESWDRYVETANAGNKKIIFILGFDNPWLYSDNEQHRDLTEREIPYFLKYVEQVVSRYRGKVAAYEIWNEPNLFFWKGSDEHFFALSKATAQKIKEIDPNVQVLACSNSRVSEPFIRGMFKAGAMENTDGISIHPYASDAYHILHLVDRLRRIMKDFNYDKPIWITEVGFPTDGFYFTFNKEKRRPENIVKTLGGLAVRGEVRSMLWYELQDDFNPEDVPDHWIFDRFLGLMYPNKTFKIGAESYKLTARHLAGSEYRPELPERENVSASITSLYFRKGNQNILLLWNNNRGTRNIRLTVPGTAELSNYSIITGEAENLASGSALAVSRDPLFIVWEGESSVQIRSAQE